MKNHRVEYSIEGICACFGVSRSGYYAWLQRKTSGRSAHRQHLDERVRALFAKHKCRYGAKRIQQQIQQDDQRYYNLKTVAASMQRQGLVAKAARKFKATTNSKHNLPVFDNRLEQDFSATAPNQKWVGDITYLWTATGWMYLAVVLDLFSRKVVGWQLSDSPDTALVLAALNQAVTLRQIHTNNGLLFHSDQGCQYTSHAYQERLTTLGIQASMSRRGNCWDNAVMERFFRTLKVEAISRERYPTAEQLAWAVKKYLHFYHTKRLHSANGTMNPNQYEQLFLKQA